ncbi:GNAT family N-acetyltransferase [Bradyrhizobium sp. SZCCHNR1051]|uniref:GNAT family N-acetyltransferase n=1 Tax=Bradyrhizobium sp. SZCCHNR1051 TaxID=3057355 RepID=UPI002916AE94|nr:GNAT family N-acetyltransferase [Bradyrhizobium sp. SZCCHNR1051]
MLQDITTPTLREARPCVLETPRLTLRAPVLADVTAIARLADDRVIAENTRRLPHPYSEVDAARFVRALAEQAGETAFLIEHLDTPIGMVGINRPAQGRAELGYWLGVDHWGRGFGTEAARATIDYFFEEGDEDVLIGHARVSNPASRNILEKCGFQWTGVELHRFEVIGSSAPVDAFRLTRGVWGSLKAWANAGRRN